MTITGAYPDPPQSHDFIPIDYLGFTNFYNGVNNMYPRPVMLDFAAPHALYLDTFTGYSGSVTLDFNANGTGVSFGEPMEIPPGTFDSGIDKYLPKQDPPPYTAYDTSGITRVDPTAWNTFWAMSDAFDLGSAAGDAECWYKLSLPFAWMAGYDEFDWLARRRNAAWVASGLDGTGTQYWTQASANMAAASFYTAGALEGAAAIGISEVGHATSIRCAYTTLWNEAAVVSATGTMFPAAYQRMPSGIPVAQPVTNNSSAQPASERFPGDYLRQTGKAPQMAPGVRELRGQYTNDLGKIQPWTAHYDDFGRQIARTDYNAGNIAAGIRDVHHHIIQYTAQNPAGISIDHIPGPYIP